MSLHKWNLENVKDIFKTQSLSTKIKQRSVYFMKATGVVRKIDKFGRIVIPKELRDTMKIDEDEGFEIYVQEDDQILLRKHQPGCHFCGSINNVVTIGEELICEDCIEKLVEKTSN
ncbi:MAG: AbrB/MazE/SpoVT family DNA-binding domain-containing protein [Candidatus Woesearchaeota archaeon]